MIYEVASQKGQPQIEHALRESAGRHKFGVMQVHNLKETMTQKGVEFDGEVWIYEVCNPHQAKRVLEADASVSTALPCRISLYRKGDEYRLSTIRPTALMRMMGGEGLEDIAEEVEQVLVQIMDEAAA